MFPGGKLVTNWKEAGAVDDVTFTVPSGKKWLILWGRSERDASAAFEAIVYTAADKILLYLKTVAAGTTVVNWSPSSSTYIVISMMILEAGMYVKYTYDATQTNPEVCCVVLEIDA